MSSETTNPPSPLTIPPPPNLPTHLSKNEKSNYIDNDRWVLFRERKLKQLPNPEPNETPINQIKFYLDRYRIKEALQVFSDESTLKLLGTDADFMWDIIPLICRRLRGLCQYRFRVFEGCERMLCRIAVDENCNPKEVLISLLAELSHQDQCDDDNVFRAMIRPLEGTLLRMNSPSPRDENLRWILNVLTRYINFIDLPQEYNLEGKKRLALPNDPNVKRFIEILPLMLSFIEEFNDRSLINQLDKSPMPILTESQIEEVFNGELVDDDDLINDQSPSRTESQDVSVATLLGLMVRPLVNLDLTSHCAELRLFANRCLNSILKLRPNLFSQIYKRVSNRHNSIEFSDNNSINNNNNNPENITCNGTSNEAYISLATCAYIYRCERVVSSFEFIQCFPQILTHESLVCCHIPYIVALLERTEVLIHEKGLLLLENLFKCLENDSLGQKFLNLIETTMLHKQLFRIMVFSPLCINRKRAYDMFTRLCDLLTFDCKLKLFRYVLTETELRSCVRAACIDQYRKHLTNVYRELLNLQHQLTGPQQVPSSNNNNKAIQPPQTTTTTTLDSILTTECLSPIRTSSGEVDNKQEVAINGERGDNNVIDSTSSGSATSPKDKVRLIDASTIMQRMKQLHSHYKSLSGSALVEFLELCIKACLPDLQHTDIIEHYELLLATLTMFRFLKLRQTLFIDELEEEYLTGKKLKKTFFDPIRNAIALIMSDLKLHHKDIVDGHKSKNSKVTQSSILNVSQSRNELDLLSRILGPKLEEVIDPAPKEESIQAFTEQNEADCLNWALCRLDLVESVLVRTCDLYNC